MGPNRPFFQGRQLGPEAQFTRNKSSSVNPTRRAEFTFKRLSSVPLTTEIPTFWLSFFFGLFLCEQCCAVSTAHKEKDQRRKKVRMSGSIHVFTIRWQGPNDCSDARHYLSLRQQHFSGRVFHSASVWSVFSGYLNVSRPSHWLPPHLVSVRGCGQTWRVTFYTFKLEVLPCEKGPSLTDCGLWHKLNVECNECKGDHHHLLWWPSNMLTQ